MTVTAATIIECNVPGCNYGTNGHPKHITVKGGAITARRKAKDMYGWSQLAAGYDVCARHTIEQAAQKAE